MKEDTKGIRVSQDRFLSTGPAQPKDNETIWTVPISLLTTNDRGEVQINKNAVLDEREKTISLDVNKPWKLNAGTVTFCMLFMYPVESSRSAYACQAACFTPRTGWSRLAGGLPENPHRSPLRTVSGLSTTRSL